MEMTETQPPEQVALDLRRLHYFVVVAETLNFSRAADRAGVSQQAISRQVRRLEDEVGQPLLFRTTRQVELSPAGRALLAPAQAILRGATEAVAAARAVGPDPRYRPWGSPEVGSPRGEVAA